MTLEKTMDYFHKVAAATTLDFWPYWFGIEGVTATDFLDAMDDVRLPPICMPTTCARSSSPLPFWFILPTC